MSDMSTFDSSLHPRAGDGTFAEKPLSQAEASLPPVQTFVLIDADGVEHHIQALDATSALNAYLERGGAPLVDAKHPSGATAVVESMYGHVARLSEHLAAGKSLDGCSVHIDEPVELTCDASDDASTLDTVEAALRGMFPGSIGGVTLRHAQDAETFTTEVALYDNLTWDEDLSEDDLDAHRDIVEAVYREWLNADIDVHEDWSNFTATIAVDTPRDLATNRYITSAAYGAVAKWANRTDPGTYGSPYIGAEILRRIEAKKSGVPT